MYNVIYEHYLASKDFYFNSDKLNLNHTEYKITNNWSGAETYIVTVNMSSKKNDKAVKDADITYTDEPFIDRQYLPYVSEVIID